jgi:signal transduction histidine kinase
MSVKPRSIEYPAPNHAKTHQGWLRETRTRLMLWHVGLLSGSVLLLLPLMKYSMLAALETHILSNIVKQVEDFENLRAGNLTLIDQANIRYVEQNHGSVAFNPRPHNTAEVKTLMRVFLRNRVPPEHTFLLSMINGTLYQSTPVTLPEALQPSKPAFEQLKQAIKSQTSGEILITAPQPDRLIYRVEPVNSGDRRLGALVIVHSTDSEEQEAFTLLWAAGQSVGLVALLVLVLGWWFMGKTLQPLKTLNSTVQGVSASDLSQRIPAQGNGELAHLAMTFNRMMDRLELAFQSQRDLLNDVGHQLRTPITIVWGHLELMGNDPQEIEATKKLVVEELDRMNHLVNKLILLAQSEHPNFLHLETIAIPQFMTELLAKVKVLATRNWCMDEVAAGNCTADRQRLTEAMCNLVENAIRHTNTTDTIALGSRREGNQLYLWVRDTGQGVDGADQEKIFERFVRGGNQQRSDGSGLGLAIVKAIAKAHGGSVKLESTFGQGATFNIIL